MQKNNLAKAYVYGPFLKKLKHDAINIGMPLTRYTEYLWRKENNSLEELMQKKKKKGDFYIKI